MAEPTKTPGDEVLDMTQEDFCARFVARIVATAGEGAREHAAATAPSYWEDEGQRAEGPEDCADADFSYWGDE